MMPKVLMYCTAVCPYCVRAEQLLDWQTDTSSTFSLDLFEGHHFFLVQQELPLLRCLRRYAEEHLTRWRNQQARLSV